MTLGPQQHAAGSNATGLGERITGGAAIGFAVAFNVPYAVLATRFDYPAVLRRPAGDILDLFAAGGAPLILTWHAFALAALVFAPLSVALAFARGRSTSMPALAAGAAITGALAGLAQAIGLWRWVFVVPSLAATNTDPAAGEAARLAAEQIFVVLNLYGGVAIGEHLGQWLTVFFIAAMAAMQWREGARPTALLGLASALAILIGAQEGLAIALGRAGDLFSLATITGFLGFSAWLAVTGAGMLRRG